MRTSERRQLKQDKFAETTKDIISSAVENRASIMRTVIVAAVIVVVVGGSWWYWSSHTEQANEALGKAVETFNAPLLPPGSNSPGVNFHSALERARAAHGQLQQVADRFGHTRPGQVARYLAGLAAVDAGDVNSGEAELKRAGESGDKDLAALAKLALANVYRGANRNDDALRLYRELIDHPTASVSKSTAELELASLYEATNQRAEAGKVYDQIISSDPQAAAAEIAQQRLQAMK